jgi:capsular polysaccharide biosynthesis protein
MDLRYYLKIFAKNWIWFVITALSVVAIGAAYGKYKESRPVSYQVSLLLNVTRSGTQTTDAYRFDDFYRLQADEKFADTVVKWLVNPRIVTDIFNENGIISGGINLRTLSKFFKARRLSAQAIEVDFSAVSVREAQDISESTVKELNSEIKNLNQYQKEDNWFKIVGDDPVIKEYKVNWKNVIFISLILGVFLGIWTVLVRHYLTKR